LARAGAIVGRFNPTRMIVMCCHTATGSTKPAFFPSISTFAAFVVIGWVMADAGAVRAEDPVNQVKFDCKEGKTIDAAFYSDKVDLKLSDGRSMSLPQTMSGSGIRYANADESFVFWSKGDTAFATEGADEKQTYADCVVAK
jgi:membrane-bound inhibitor of C-type lysozyme